MGDRRDFCATFYPDDDDRSRTAFADALREHVASATVDEHFEHDFDAPWVDEMGFEALSIVAPGGDDRVFAAGTTRHYREPEVWENALAAFPEGGGSVAIVDTQEGGHVGTGRLSECRGDGYVEVAASPPEPDGAYGWFVLHWFDVEHDLRPGTHRHGHLQPDDAPEGGYEDGAAVVDAWYAWVDDEIDVDELRERLS
jgi:hypothetical protein